MAVTLRPSIPVQQSTGQASHSIVVKGLTRPMFTLCWHVNRGYELVNGRFVPMLAEFPHKPGVNNVYKDGDATFALATHQRKGWVIVPTSAAMPADTPDNGAGYVRSYPGRRGTHHQHAWVSWSGGGDVWTRTIDEDGWAAWRFSLVERGLLPPIDAAGLEAMREKLHKQRDRYAGRADVNPYAASALKDIQAKIDTFEQAAEAALKPATSRRRSSK